MERSRSNDNRKLALAAAGVLLLTFLVFLPTLGNGFVNLDDDDYVVRNGGLTLPAPELLVWSFTTYTAYNYHPLTWLSLALDRAFWGGRPFGYHLTSVLLHACNAFLAVLLSWMLIRRIRAASGEGPSNMLDVLGAAAVGAFFGIHPLRVESVSWISERKDVLFAFFYFLALIEYLRFVSSGTRRDRVLHYAASILLFCCSGLSKPMAVSLPAVLLLLDAYPLRRFERLRFDRRTGSLLLEKAPYVVIAAAIALLTVLAQGTSGQIRSMEELPLAERGIIAVRAVFFYLGKLFSPADLAPFYPILRPVTATALDAVRAAAFLGVTALGIAFWKRNRGLLIVWLAYLVTLVPALGIVQVGGQAAADRYSYLPLLGPLFGVVMLVIGLFRRLSASFPRVRTELVLAAALCGLLVPLGMATAAQQRVWTDPVSLWSREIELFPTTVPVSYVNRGRGYAERGDHQRAVMDYSLAILMDPADPEAYGGRGISLLALGRKSEACADLQRALALRPWYYEAALNRGRACGK